MAEVPSKLPRNVELLQQYQQEIASRPLVAATFLRSSAQLLESLIQLIPYEKIRPFAAEELAGKDSFLTQDVISVLDKSNPDHTEIINWLLTATPEVDRLRFDMVAEGMLADHARVAKKDNSYVQPSILYAYNRYTRTLTPVLPEAEARELTFSRVDPAYSKEELDILRNQTSVIVLGASTGNVPIELAAKMGMRVILFDGDRLDASNITRFGAGGYSEIGENKAVLSGTKAMDTFPYSDITAYPHNASVEEIAQVIEQEQVAGRHVVLVESIDTLAIKHQVRELQKNWQGDQPWNLIMGTNMSDSLIDHETQDDKPFFSEVDFPKIFAELAALKAQVAAKEILPTVELQKNTEIVAEIIGKQYIPVRQMITFLLLALGEVNYLVQDGLHAYASGSAVTEAVIQTALGRQINKRSQLKLGEILGVPESQQVAAELKYILSRMDDYPSLGAYRHLFAPLAETGVTRTGLDNAMKQLVKNILTPDA